MRMGARRAGRSRPVIFPGEGGMDTLRYIGQAPNRRRWIGPVTGVWYQFGPGDVRYVDKRDATVWLKPLKGDGRAFERDSS